MMSDVPTKYTCKTITQEEFKEFYEDTTREEEADWKGYESKRFLVEVYKGVTKLDTQIAALINKKDEQKNAYVTTTQVSYFKIFTRVHSPSLTNFDELLRATDVTKATELPFTKDKRKSLFIPADKSVAARVILAFYNGFSDPADRIREILGAYDPTDDHRVARALVTYYLSCLKYITDFEISECVILDTTFEILVDDLSFIPSAAWAHYAQAKKEERAISPSLVCFQAVYGAFCICRSVANKRDFKSWVMKRYSSLMSSLQQTSEANANPKWISGGNLINEMSTERPQLKRIIYNVIRKEYKDTKAHHVRQHISMLVNLSEMTTFSLIQKVILYGGAVTCLTPLPEQFQKYITERKALEAKLEEDGISASQLTYIHLIYPGTTCFTAAHYPDMIVTANVIEAQRHPKANTLQDYKGKTENSTINEKIIEKFLMRQRDSPLISTSDLAQTQLESVFGQSASTHIKEAQRIMDILNKNDL